jgi:hypothetical protein
MHKIIKLTRAKRNLIVEEVSKSYNKYKKYQNLATKYAIVNDHTKVFTSYNKIQQEIKKLLIELNGNYKVIVGNRKVELIMMDENDKTILTKSIIVYKNKTEIKSTARTNRTDLKLELEKVYMDRLYNITREYVDTLNSLLGVLKLNVSLFNIEYSKRNLTINVIRKYIDKSNDKATGSLIYSYAFSDLCVNAIYKKPDKIKEMVYLSLGIIIK